ncbi:toxin-antitoxin system HicB family antitoxin [Marinihelvus fidelis]|uniref:Toxin-antitoxin system HicB family antitoxin n=1 Tax=Marinihelvus fidelis TaxID=2613842 RepID=A0A5N0T496_9GAMM|nr:toxin-antitoxin system HicB family antitoxin [Marinihelvus fidelis]KAA9129733.1 toxin-antitoxin system HicB family antitoxin [Marinihelvus fidelis]
MGTLTVRLPDEQHRRLKALAKRRRISVNKLMEELSTRAIVEFDVETRFRALASRGSVEQGLDALRQLDEAFENPAR